MIYLDKEILWALRKLKKEFWDKFEDYYDQIKEIQNVFFLQKKEDKNIKDKNKIDEWLKLIKEKLFDKFDKKEKKLSDKKRNHLIKLSDKKKELFDKKRNHLIKKKEKLSDKFDKKEKKLSDKFDKKEKKLSDKKKELFEKYFDHDYLEKNPDTIRFKKINWKIRKKLKKINFFNNFSKSIQLEFPTGGVGQWIKDYLYDFLIKKYYDDLVKEGLIEKNDEKDLIIKNYKKNNLFPISLKHNLSYITLIQNLNQNKIQRIYCFKLKQKNENIKLEKGMTILHESKSKKKIILHDVYGVEDRTEKIKELILNKDDDKKINKKIKSKLIYQTNSKTELEQIWIKAWKASIKVNNLNFFNNYWLITKKKLILEIKNNEIEKQKDYPDISNSIHKVIITTTREGKINQSLKDRIHDLVTFDNIINFEETIYLSKKSFWSAPREKHSFQFLIKDFFKDEKNWKKFNNLINYNKQSHHKYKFYKYKFLNKNSDDNDDIELEIIPVGNPINKNSKCP